MNGMKLVAAGGALFASAAAFAGVSGDTMGDNLFQSVYNGYGGAGETLTGTLANYRDPVTGQAAPILHQSGRELVIGDVALGEDPYTSDQLQYQRFLVTDGPADLQISYLGVGQAGYKSIFGVYTYSAADDPLAASITMQPLFVQNVDKKGEVFKFTVPEDHYFGFYIDANGYKNSQGTYFTENFRNSDASRSPDGITDHFLTFNSNQGLLIAMEDLAYNSKTGKMGDQDYEDMMAGFLSYQNGTPVNPGPTIPEPATLTVVAAGGLILLRRGRRDRG